MKLHQYLSIVIVLLLSYGAYALPGKSRKQLIAQYKAKGLTHNYNHEFSSIPTKLAQITHSLTRRLRVEYTEIYENPKATNNIWAPLSSKGKEILLQTASEELIKDYQEAKLLYQGSYYTNAGNPWPGERRKIRTGKRYKALPIYKTETIWLFKGKKFGYEVRHEHSFDKSWYLKIIPKRKTARLSRIFHFNNKKFNESRGSDPTKVIIAAGKIQSHAVYGEKKTGTPKNIFFSYVPKSLEPGKKTYLLIVNHGDGGSGNGTIRPWIKVAEELQIVVAAPSFNVTDFSGDLAPDDLIKATISTLQKKINLHEKTIISGFSSGGAFTYLFATQNPQLVKAYAVHSASALGGFSSFQPQASVKQIPVLITCGLKGRNTCGGAQSFIQTTKKMNFQFSTYTYSRKFKPVRTAMKNFIKRIIN